MFAGGGWPTNWFVSIPQRSLFPKLDIPVFRFLVPTASPSDVELVGRPGAMGG